MTRRLFAVIAFLLLLPTICFAHAICFRGNQPKSALNYPSWPGLIDVVNDVSRESWCWENGDEHLCYRGDATALNRVLKEFAEVEADEVRVLLLPGPGQLHLLHTTNQEQSKNPSSDYADWELHIVQGLVRGGIERYHLEAIFDMDPTLTVYVTERIDLNALRIPERIKVVQHADLRKRYEDTYASGDKRRGRGKRELDELDAKTPKEGTAADEFQSRLTEIQEFVRRRTAAKNE